MTNPSWRQSLTAAAVLLHALTIAVLSVPVPPAALRGEREDARTTAALAPWGDAAEAVGIPREVLFGAVHRFTRAEHAALTALRAPLRPYARLVGAQQAWLMFGSVRDDTARLEILVQTGGEWAPLYVARDAEAAWRRPLFDQERMRTLVFNFAARRSKTRWPPFVAWVARQVRADRPDAAAVRVQMRRVHVPGPDVLAETGALELGDPYWITERRLVP